MALLLRPFFAPNPACHHPSINPTTTKSHRLCLRFPNRNSSSSLPRTCAAATSSGPEPANPNESPKKQRRRQKPEPPSDSDTPAPASGSSATDRFPSTIPRKPRRGRRGEAAAVEDFVRASLERTFAAIREQGEEVSEGKSEVLRERVAGEDDDEDEDDREEHGNGNASGSGVVEEEDPDWPLDADVGWGVRASEYFEKHPIRNVVVDGVEIDWEGEMENEWVKEINCLEWESFAFHPSPLIVLVFERYKRAAENWKVLKELEKAAKVYWSAKDRLPPRTVKIDINIETDLAYALKVREGPQLLFLRGNRILYREKEIRTADELVPMIAYFYYNARKPLWINDDALAPPY